MTSDELGRLLAARDPARIDAAIAAVDHASAEAAALQAERLRRARREAEAAPLFAIALAAFPALPELLHTAALADVALGRHASACERWESLLATAPNVAGAWFNLGLARASLGRVADAVAAWDRAAALMPDDPRPLARAAAVLGERAALPDAIDRLTRAIAVAPKDPALYFARAAHRSSLALHTQALDDLRVATGLAPQDAAGGSALLVELHYDLSLATPDALPDAHRAWAMHHAAVATLPRPPRSARPKMRVGYLSPRFGDAPLAALLAPVLEAHDRTRFEIIAYAASPARGGGAERVRNAVDRWRDLPASDERAAREIAGDDLDLLVDLAGHAPGNRLPMLSRRPARVQAVWLDWFDTTGVPAVDWLISDAVHTPASESRRYSERLVLLPHARFVYRPPVPLAATDAPMARNGHVTFGSFNRHAKLTDDVIATWSRILRALPDARLQLRASAYASPSTVDFVRDRWARCGVPVDRIAFAPFVALDALHRAYGEVDIALDPFPFAGGVTTCDALAHGVPVVTLAGDRMIARQGAALLRAAGHPEWIAPDRYAYVDLAVALAERRALPLLRARLASEFVRSPLADVAGFTRTLERAYVAMAEAGDAGHAPLHIGPAGASR